MLLIDDDSSFCRIMEKLGPEKNVAVISCQSLDEINHLAQPDVFDIAVIDYYLDGARRDLKGTVVAQHLGSTPTIFISHSPTCPMDNEGWPHCVRKFLPKEGGPEGIFNEAWRLKRLSY
jgi:DNA-binding NtrC family response regulator